MGWIKNNNDNTNRPFRPITHLNNEDDEVELGANIDDRDNEVESKRSNKTKKIITI